jgi:hypothetical protein
MQSLKVSCTRCSHYQQCSQKTRFFVNYCGSDITRLKEDIRRAVSECINRRGSLFTDGIKIEFHLIKARQAAMG